MKDSNSTVTVYSILIVIIQFTK